jgi:hypothetical protein
VAVGREGELGRSGIFLWADILDRESRTVHLLIPAKAESEHMTSHDIFGFQYTHLIVIYIDTYRMCLGGDWGIFQARI